ncbi:MAG: hypothetical protein Q9186_003497 [Xanthomendoza sp. 1 TL-2023]
MENPNTLPLPHDRKRRRSSSRPPWDRANKSNQQSPNRGHTTMSFRQEGRNGGVQNKQESFAREQTRRNQAQESEQMRVWVSKEDEFVLRQSKKKAHIRIKEGRAKSIDRLAVTLDVIDSTKDLLEDEGTDSDVEVVNPAGVFEGLGLSQLQELGKEIQSYLTLETNSQNRKYWDSLRIICQDHQIRLAPTPSQRRAGSSVSADIDRLLAPKSAEELASLKVQVTKKLQSNEPIDVEYWEQLLNNIAVYSAKAALNDLYKSVIDSRLEGYRHQQTDEAAVSQQMLEVLLSRNYPAVSTVTTALDLSKELDPEPLLKLKPEDRALDTMDETQFLASIASDRQRVQKMGYFPPRALQSDKAYRLPASRPPDPTVSAPSPFIAAANDDFSQATTALYEREVARGVQENEEIFAGEEDVQSSSKPQWASKYRPRKPRYFNRVQMGYEWNKYNQTHYDHDNPPPKVVQGYKFNIFYPDLLDRTKAPTYRIERENGRRRGQSFAPAGEEDTCLIRFISGPPYEDLAFRIVDKEWDYSAKRERGFRSSFDKGILQLHFQFKKVYYRK